MKKLISIIIVFILLISNTVTVLAATKREEEAKQATSEIQEKEKSKKSFNPSSNKSQSGGYSKTVQAIDRFISDELGKVQGQIDTDESTGILDVLPGGITCADQLQKSLLGDPRNFVADIGPFFESFIEIFTQTQCYLEDQWMLEDRLEEIQKTGILMTQYCNEDNTELIKQLNDLYEVVQIDLALLREYKDASKKKPIENVKKEASEDDTEEEAKQVGKTPKQIFLNDKGLFGRTYREMLKDNRYNKNEIEEIYYNNMLKRTYWSKQYQEYSEENKEGCKLNAIQSIVPRIKKLIQTWKDMAKIFTGAGLLEMGEDIVKDAKKQAKAQAKQYLSSLAASLDLGIIKLEIAVETKDNTGGGLKSMGENLKKAWNTLEKGFVDFWNDTVDTTGWTDAKKSFEDVKGALLMTQSYFIEKLEEEDRKERRDSIVGRKKAEYLMLFGGVEKETGEHLQNKLILLDACIQKGYVVGHAEQKALGCFMNFEQQPLRIKASGNHYSLPNFEEFFQAYINRQCNGSISRCALKPWSIDTSSTWFGGGTK